MRWSVASSHSVLDVPTTVVDFSSGAPEIVRRGSGDPTRFE